MRYKMTFSYDGTNFSGYQIQNEKRTVQEEIEKCLKKINHEENIKIYASGRTDRHVHALHQTAHFDMEEMDPENLRYRLNRLLPSDIYVQKLEEVSADFHARFTPKKKTYLYKINCLEYNPLEVNYVFQYNSPLDIENMKRAANYFLGEHDFTSFTKATGKKEDMVRTIYEIKFEEVNGILSIEFTGNGFLQYMVRNMVGFLIEVGEHKKVAEDVKKVLEMKDRREAAITASPNGLYLKKIEYENLSKN